MILKSRLITPWAPKQPARTLSQRVRHLLAALHAILLSTMTKKKRFLATNGALTTIQTKSLRLTLVKFDLNLIFREATIDHLWSKTSLKSSSRQPKRNNQPLLRASSAREGVERGALSRATWPTNEQEFRKMKTTFRMIRRTCLISCFPIAT